MCGDADWACSIMSHADLTGTSETRNLSSGLAMTTVVATTYFALVIVAMHFIRPDISPIQRPTSEYAVGRFGYLMTSAFLSLSVGTWALVLGLRRDLPHRGPHRIGTMCLAVWGVGLLVAATFPIDAEGAPQTLAGTIHGINGPLIFLSLMVGMNLVSRGFKSDPGLRRIHRFASTLALLMIPEFVVVGIASARGSGVGLAQRLLILTFATWFLLVASQLRSDAVRRGRAS